MTNILKDNGNRVLPYDTERMRAYIQAITVDLPQLKDDLEDFTNRIHAYVNLFDELSLDELNNRLITEAQSRIEVGATEWDKLAERILLKTLYKKVSKARFYDSDEKYGSFYGLLTSLVSAGIFSEDLITKYSKEEITHFGNKIDSTRDLLFTYTGLDLLSSRYLAKLNGEIMELPQERWMVIAMYLMQNETTNRNTRVLNAYWALSNLLMTVATPTMANAGHVHGQLSSCFPAHTMIRLDTEDRAISEVKEGDIVVTHDGARKKVTAVNVREDTEGLYTLKLEGVVDFNEPTGEHPFMIHTTIDDPRVIKELEGDGTTEHAHWVKTKDITVDDYVVTANASATHETETWKALEGYLFVKVKSNEFTEGSNTVFNLEVEDHHTYVANNMITHNCFITAPEDSLDGIYQNELDIARVSKWGGGVGVYVGFLRSQGADIRGVKGASGGIVPWVKGLNNIAVSVDQLGSRSGAINITLDVFHKDILAFLDLRLNNGDERLRARDIFTTVSVPDLFMEQVKKRGDWFLFDPHEIYSKYGWYLQDAFDETMGEGTFRDRYTMLVNDTTITKTSIPAITIMKAIMKSQLETGTPFMFFRDTVNRMNPNKHKGIIYSSNLCQEIAQNVSSSTYTTQYIDGDKVITEELSGDMVVCNLSSINLAKFIDLSSKEQELLISTQVRMLDNVIDLNDLPVPKATITNRKYRAIGLGTFGFHEMLVKSEAQWDSVKSRKLTEQIYERINFLAIHASSDLAKEKGVYPLFAGSDWGTGAYFDLRDYTDTSWKALKEKVYEQGLRNGYIMAIAPNMSTAQIAGTTPSIDPVFDLFYYQENKKGRQPVVAPGLDFTTYQYYETSAVKQNQFASIDLNAIRQRHVDQSQSFNLYIPSDIKASTLLRLLEYAWESELKTLYYIRARDTEVEECVWCQ